MNEFEELVRAAATHGSNCANAQDEFSGWDAPGRTAPTEEQARQMCHRCPVFDLCEDFAKAEEPYFGVWAGNVYGAELAGSADD